YYAERFPTVEINNTFYRMPKEDLIQGWAGQVPEHFAFVIKASRRITHDKRLKECAEPLGYLYRVTSTLGPRLGPLLFHLPPASPLLAGGPCRPPKPSSPTCPTAGAPRSGSVTPPGSTTRSLARCGTGAPRSVWPTPGRSPPCRWWRRRIGATCGCDVRTSAT